MPDGLSSKAKSFFNMEDKEEGAMVKKTEELSNTVTMVEGDMPVAVVKPKNAGAHQTLFQNFEFVVDSPKMLWDGIGHIQFKFTVLSLEEADAKLDEVVGFWQAVKEKYTDLINQPAPMTQAQKAYLEKLFGIPLPAGMESFSKEEASAKINEEQKAQNKEKLEGQRQNDSGSKYSYTKNQTPPQGWDGDKKPASERTLKFMESIAKRKNLQLSKGYQFMSQSEASAWIKENN